MLEFIGYQDMGGREDRSFRPFQDLSPIVRDALAWGTEEQDRGEDCDERDVTAWIINRWPYDDSGTHQAIGVYIEEMSRFISRTIRCRMVRCYVDNGCNMVRAKLAWHEDY